MVELIPLPDPQRLLPPLLACLPTAFASHQPPPALLPLISPILRQRLQLITSTSGPSSENWLKLLCWDQEKAGALKDVVENGTYEPHPSSGEIEVGDIGVIKYKRLDQETLRAQIVLSEWSLIALYLWCSEEEEGSGWKLGELLPYDSDLERNPTWSQSIAEANETSRERIVSEAIRDAEAAEHIREGQHDDDEYWALYDKTPGRSPSHNRSPAHKGATFGQRVDQSERDYYAQYGEVQPAMDNHDPSEVPHENEGSSLRGDVLESITKGQTRHLEDQVAVQGYLDAERGEIERTRALVCQPQPSPPSTASSNAVSRLEERADRQSTSEIGIRQHLSTTMKSLYRLANSVGMEREEFNGIIQKELEANSMFDD